MTREARSGPLAKRLSSANLPGGMVPVAAGLVVLGITAYGFLVLAARSLGPERYAPLSVLWALVFLVGPGVFVPLEQELARAVSARQATGGVVEDLVRKAALTGAAIAGLLVVVALGAGSWMLSQLFDHQPLLLVGLVLSLVGYFAEHWVRGALAGTGQFGAYGLILATEGSLRLGGCVALAIAGVSTPGAYGLVLGAAPIGAAAIGARGRALLSPRPASHAEDAHGSGPAVPAVPAASAGPSLTNALGWLLAGSLFAQLLINGAPIALKLLATAAEKATVGRFVAGLIVARVPLFLFASVQAAALPRLARQAAAGLHEEFRAGLCRLLVVVGAFGLAGTVGAGVLGPTGVRIMFGAAFRLGRSDLIYLAAASAFYMLAMTVAQALIALCAQPRVAIGWFVGLIVFVAVVALTPGLLLRAERGLLAGSVVAAAVMGAGLLPLLGGRVAPLGTTSEEPALPPPTIA